MAQPQTLQFNDSDLSSSDGEAAEADDVSGTTSRSRSQRALAIQSDAATSDVGEHSR
jgi:hypothetical protein